MIIMNDSKKVKIKKIYCIKCNKYRKFKNDKIYILYKTLVFCIICDKWAVMVKTYLLKKYQLKLNQIKSNSWFNKSCK